MGFISEFCTMKNGEPTLNFFPGVIANLFKWINSTS